MYDRDVVGDLAHDAEIVGDEQHRHTEPRLKIFQELKDLSLNGDVERRGWLVGDEEIRSIGESHSDHHALTLPAGELMRIGAQPGFGVRDADFGQEFDHAGPDRAGARVVQFDDLADLLFDGVQRIERGHRLLEDHRDPRAAHAAKRPLAHGQHVLAIEQDLSAGMPRGGIGQQAHERLGRHRLARTGFADQRERAPALQREGDAIDHRRFAESDGEIAHIEQRRGHRNVFRGSKASRTASPMKTSSDSISATMKKAERPSQGAARFDLPSLSSSPSEGAPGGMPRPR